MSNMIKLGFTPLACCWVHKPGTAREILAVYVHPHRVFSLSAS